MQKIDCSTLVFSNPSVQAVLGERGRSSAGIRISVAYETTDTRTAHVTQGHPGSVPFLFVSPRLVLGTGSKVVAVETSPPPVEKRDAVRSKFRRRFSL